MEKIIILIVYDGDEGEPWSLYGILMMIVTAMTALQFLQVGASLASNSHHQCTAIERSYTSESSDLICWQTFVCNYYGDYIVVSMQVTVIWVLYQRINVFEQPWTHISLCVSELYKAHFMNLRKSVGLIVGPYIHRWRRKCCRWMGNSPVFYRMVEWWKPIVLMESMNIIPMV